MAKEAVNRAFESSLSEGAALRTPVDWLLATDTNPKVAAAFIEKRAPPVHPPMTEPAARPHQRQRRTSYRLAGG